MSLMQAVPESLLREVLQQLVRAGDFAAVAAASCTCRAMAQLAAEEELWAAAWQRSWPTSWGMLCEQSALERSDAPVRPAPLELAHAMAASSPPEQQAAQVAAAMTMLSVCTQASEERQSLDGELHSLAAADQQLQRHQPTPSNRQSNATRLRDMFRYRSEAVRWQREARGDLPRPLAAIMARLLVVATGRFVLEGEVTDSSDGNTTPAHVELALSHGYGSTDTAVALGTKDGHSDVGTSSAYARAGSLHASVCYGKGTLHNAPTDAVWSGGWCARPPGCMCVGVSACQHPS